MDCPDAPSLESAFVAVAAWDRRLAERLAAAAYTPDTAVLAADRQSCKAAAVGDCVACPAVALIAPSAVVRRAALRAIRQRNPRRRRSRRRVQVRSDMPARLLALDM